MHERSEQDPRVHRTVVSYVRRSARMRPYQHAVLAVARDRLIVDVPRGELSTSVAAGSAPLDLDRVFGRRAPLVVEIGPGAGESLVAMAAERPASNVLAFEVYEPSLARIATALTRSGPPNVRLVQADAVQGLQELLTPGSVSELWTFFPDPWPKARHHKRRIVQPAFADLAASRVAPGGRWWLATDWADYAEHIRAVLDPHPAWLAVPAAGTRPLSRFERRGLAAGREITDLVYVRR